MTHGDMPDSGLPPDRAAAGDVTTTGHSSHDVQPYDTHDTHDAHTADDAHGGHGPADTSDQPTLVPTSWRQLIFPAVILLFVAVLVAGPVMNAFSSRPAAIAPAEQPTAVPSTAPAVVASPTLAATAVPQPTATVQAAKPPSPTAGSSSQYFLQVIATATAVALEGAKGDVARAPVKLTFGGASFSVTDGSGLLPDWKASQDDSTATWIDGTFANHILYIGYSAKNQALFGAAKTGDNIQLQMNTGQVFNFSVTRSQRAVNGPTTNPEQFSVSAAMQQDHAGVTLFLTGDPAADRAVVQADFTGNIQSALP